MKKLYFLALLFCLCFKAFAQPITVTIWATGVSGTFITGNSTSSVRTDDNIVTTSTTQRGYAVFDLTGIPAGSNVNSVDIGAYVQTYAGAGIASGWNTYGYAGDLSAITTAGALFPAMVSGTSLSTATYGGGVGNFTIASSPTTVAFVQANVNSIASVCFTGGNSRIYTFTGETGTTASTTSALHAPYITITYCPPPSGVTATATPNPICEGSTLTLTSTPSGASGGYIWSGPGGYSSATASPTLTAVPTAAGVYTLTAITSCTTYSASATATTTFVSVNPVPASITGNSAVCTGDATTLSSTTLGGDWTSSDGAIATVGLSSGVVVGVASGPVTITYMLTSGCYVTFPMMVNDPPTVISGPTEVCESSTITLTNGSAGGIWTSDLPGIADVGSSSGIVTGMSVGTATITYVTGGCTQVTYDVTVNAAPAPISGLSEVCEGSTITLSDPTGGGTWSSGAITIAMVGSTGIVTGVSGGTVNIIYTLTSTTGCQAIKVVTVDPLPATITGLDNVCIGQSILLSDATLGGDFSSLSSLVSVTTGGSVGGITAGVATITYTVLSTGCSITTPVTVNPLPAAIGGPTEVCQNGSITLTDSDPGGTWSSAVTTTATVGSSSGIVNGVTATNVNISYTLPTGCSTVLDVTVNPAPISGITPASATTFCAGGSVILNATAGGTTYQWSNGSGPIAGATNASYTATATGSYTVDITNTFLCSTTSAAIAVTAGINAVIDHTAALNFCIGGSITLSANTGGAVGTILYQWQKGGVDIAGATFVTHNATTSGVYTCVVTVSGGSGTCVVTTPAVTVVVNALPTPTIAYSGTVLSTANTYAAYQWYVNTYAITGATNYTYAPAANGMYRVRVGDGIGCSGYSNQIQVTNFGTHVAVPQVSGTDVRVYPNPANDIVYIESQVPVRAVITGVEGKVLSVTEDVHSINISSLATGMYILMLYNEQGERIAVQKLIKE